MDYMKNTSEIFLLISGSLNNLNIRKKESSLRKRALSNFSGLKKFAFDTRRIDQETQFNPRRGLQNYNRSEEFISKSYEDKLISFAKLRNVLSNLKDVYGKKPEWQDSNARVLLSTLDNGLRTFQKDGDFSDAQPAMGNLSYIEELLNVRYRLTSDSLQKLAEEELKNIVLAKDEELSKSKVYEALNVTKQDIAKESYDTLLEKLFGGVKATPDNPEVERTITITIKDICKK